MRSDGIEFTVYGQPVPQGSKRLLRGNIVDMAKPQLRSYRQDIHVTALQEMAGASPFSEPVEVRVMFSIPRPKSHYRTGRNAHLLRDILPIAPAKTPDIDKLARAVLDALTGAAFRDDAQVVGLTASKVWADHSSGAATTVAVMPLSSAG